MLPLLGLAILALAAAAGASHMPEAASQGQLESVRAMLAAGTPPDERLLDHPWSTGLMVAASRRRVSLMRELLTAGADPNLRDANGRTALMLASQAGLKESVHILLEVSAEVNAQDGQGEHALSIAASRGHTAIVRLLLAAGADAALTPQTCQSTLFMAASGCHTGVVQVLLQAGATGGARDPPTVGDSRKGCANLPPLPPPPSAASAPAHCALVAPIDMPVAQVFALHEQFMLSAMAHEPRVLPAAKGAVGTANDAATTSIAPNASAVAEIVAAAHDDANADAGAAATASATAAALGSVRDAADHAESPKAAEASEAAKTAEAAERRAAVGRAARLVRRVLESLLGMTPPAGQEAHRLKPQELLASLASAAGADAPSRSALYLASRRRHLPSIRLLLSRGASADARASQDGTTPLLLAASLGHVEVVTALLDAGASVRLQAWAGELSGMSALHVASWQGHAKVRRHLRPPLKRTTRH